MVTCFFFLSRVAASDEQSTLFEHGPGMVAQCSLNFETLRSRFQEIQNAKAVAPAQKGRSSYNGMITDHSSVFINY